MTLEIKKNNAPTQRTPSFIVMQKLSVLIKWRYITDAGTYKIN